jgi:hypothetical protein
MYERKRRAIDVEGHSVEVVERRAEALDGGPDYLRNVEYFGPGGEPLIPEGGDFYRTPFGLLFKVVD